MLGGCRSGAVATDESASFAAEATGGKPPYYYNWSFPGGSPPTSTSRLQDVIYDATGTYTGTVTVTDDAGGKGRGRAAPPRRPSP